MGIVNKRVFTKSYALEILKDGEKPEIFAFSMPPKSEEFTFGQRVSETKTFGGSVIDRYGNDTIGIVLSGSTGNEDNKIIYRGLKPPLYLNGEREIFWIAKKLNECHSQDNLAKKLDIYLYDLSKMNVAELVALSPSRNWWKVFIKSFKIKRDDSKPKTFNYVLDLIAVIEENKKKITGLFENAAGFVDGFTKAMEKTQEIMDYTEGAFALAEEAANTVTRFKKNCEEFQNTGGKGRVLTALKGADSFSRILTGNTNNTLYNSAKSVLSIASQFAKWGGEGREKSKAEGKIQNTSSFVVTFDSNGGSVVPSQSIEYSGILEKPKDPERDEYAFDCWCSDRELATEYDFSNEVTKTMTLYAKWELAVATITFNTNFGGAVKPMKVNIGEKLPPPENPTKRGFVFKEWCTDIEGVSPFDFESPIAANMTLYASWAEACTVVFDMDGGSDVPEQTVKMNGLVVYPHTPTKENFAFSHWCSDADREEPFDFSTPVTTDITLYAVFVRITNKIVFDPNGGSAVESQYVAIGARAARPAAPEKEGFEFVCWCSDRNCTNEFLFDTVVDDSMTLYAEWRVKTLTVTFSTNGGSAVPSQSVRYMEKVIFPAAIPTKENCVFEMWQKRSEEKTAHTGRYETVIVYEDDGVTPKVDENTGVALTERVEVMDYEYTEFDFNTEITENLNLYAKWFGGGE